MKVFAMKNKQGEINYYLRQPKGLTSYGAAKDIAIMGAGFPASWAVDKLTVRFHSLRAAKAAGLRVVQSFNVEPTYAR